jgi:hypothetical protein
MVSKRTTVLKTTTRLQTKTTVSSTPFLPFAAAGKFPQRRGFCGGVRMVSSSSSSSGRGGGGTEGGSGDEEEEEEKDDDSTEKEVKEARKEAETPPPLPESLSRGAAAAGRAPILPGGPRRRRRPDERLKTKEEEEEENKKFEKLQNSLFLSLLVTEGAIKGSAMTALGLLLNVKVIDSFRFLSESASGGDGDVVLLGTGVSSAVGVGIACAMPLVLIDFAIMNLFFPSETSTSPSSSDASDAPSLRTAVSNYAKEASLNNPCLNMPFYKDAIVASVARVADSFACVFTLGFLFTWITERGVEYGFEVYEIENTTKWLALAATVLGKEAMIFYESYRRKGFGAGGGADGEKAGGKKEKRAPGMRAYVVTRDKITGKEKMEEITAENIEAKKKRGEKLEPQELAIESAMYNMNVRSTIDNWRERISNGLLGFSFVVSGGNGAAPLVGGLLGDLLFCVYQRNNVKKYLEKYGVDDESNSSNSSSSSRSRSSSSSSSSSGNKMRTSIAVAKARQREMQSVLVKKMKEKEGETNNTTASESVGTSSSTNSTSSQKINDMIQAVQKEASLVARLVVEADEKESLLSSSSTPARATRLNAERKAFKTLENKLPKLMTGLFDGETPELSEYEVAFKEASNFLRTEKASLESKIQSFDESIEKYRAMFAFIFSNDDVNDEDEDDVREKENEVRRETNLEVGKKTKDEGGGTAVEAKEEDDGASFAEKFANFF